MRSHEHGAMAELDAAHLERWKGYFYPETITENGDGVLRNLAGIRDPALAKNYEYWMTSMRQVQLDLGRAEVPHTYDVDHLRAIHRHLFQDVYDWAGEFRTVDMAKAGKAFARVGERQFDQYLEDVTQHIAETPWPKLDQEQFAQAMAETFAPLNQAHPFREGNGRSTKVFLEHVAEQSRFTLNYDDVTSLEWKLRSQSSRPMDDGIVPRPEKIAPLFEHISSPRTMLRPVPEDQRPTERPTVRSLFSVSYPKAATAATERAPIQQPPRGRHARRDHETGPRRPGAER